MSARRRARHSAPVRVLFARRRIILQKLLHCLSQVLLLLLGFGLWVNGLACHAAPDQIVVCRIVHVHGQLADVDGRSLPSGGAHSAPSAVPPAAIPASAISPVAAERGELFFLTNSSLIADKKIRAIITNLGEPFCRQFCVYSGDDLFFGQIVNL